MLKTASEHFVEAGLALGQIRDRRLWIEFPSFDAYCRAKWQLGRDYARPSDLCRAGLYAVADNLSRDTYGEHELRKSLPDMVFHEQVLLFAAGILWEQASGGRRKLLPEV